MDGVKLLIIFTCFINTAIYSIIRRKIYSKCQLGLTISFMSNIVRILLSSIFAEELQFYDTNIIILVILQFFLTVLVNYAFYIGITSMTFVVFYNLRILFVSILSKIVLHSKFSALQYAGKVIIFFGSILEVFISDKIKISLICTVVLVGAFLSALSSVLFVAYIKDAIHDMWSYSFCCNLLSFPFYMLGAIFELVNIDRKNTAVMHSPDFAYAIVTDVIYAQMSVILSLRCDAIEKNILTNLYSVSSSIVTDRYILGVVKPVSIFSCLLVYVGVQMYDYSKAK